MLIKIIRQRLAMLSHSSCFRVSNTGTMTTFDTDQYLYDAFGQLIDQLSIEINKMTSAKKKLESERAQLKNAADPVISKNPVEINGNHTISRPVVYHANWTWDQKAEFALKQIGEYSSTASIADYLISVDPTLGESRTTSIKSLSSVLSTNKSGKFVKRTSARGGNDYFLTELTDTGIEEEKQMVIELQDSEK